MAAPRMKPRRVDLTRWIYVQKGTYRTRCGCGRVVQVGPNDWSGHVGPPGFTRQVGNGTTAAQAAMFVEQALDQNNG